MNSMLSKALCEFMTGPLNQLVVNLGGQDGKQWEEEFKRFLCKEPCWSGGQAPQELSRREALLSPVSTVIVPATSSMFVAKDKFIGNAMKSPVVRLGDNFCKWFLSDDGKIERPISERSLRSAILRKVSVDGPIIEVLGGREKAETALAEVFFLMEKQSKGTDGVLLNDGLGNIFYIKDISGLLRSVCVQWYGIGWFVDAGSLESIYGWSVGHQVFSRNSTL